MSWVFLPTLTKLDVQGACNSLSKILLFVLMLLILLFHNRQISNILLKILLFVI